MKTNFAKTLVLGTVFSFIMSVPVSNIHADLVAPNGVDISDRSGDNVNLYQLFNNYFSRQLGKEGRYASSNDLYEARGVDPATSWVTSGSQIVGAFKVAALGHDMSMVNAATGETIASIMHVAGTTNLGSGLKGITDLSGKAVTNIADGIPVDFRLDASYNSVHQYTWTSGLGGNVDGMTHMLAFDITDLYNAKYDTANDSVFMFAWEDLSLNGGRNASADWDYQDFVSIVTNVKQSATTSPTPEPGTLAILGLGLAGLGWARCRRRK